MKWHPRGLAARMLAAIEDTPVTILEGARASGKTTLVKMLQDSGAIDELVDLSDPAVFSAATAAPAEFVESLPARAAIDEAQLIPDLSLAVKRRIDANPDVRMVLTGSYRIGQGALGGSDPLVGRSIRFQLFPFTLSERRGSPFNILPLLFADGPLDLHLAAMSRGELIGDIVRGGFPLTPPNPSEEYMRQSLWGSLHRDLTSGRDIERIRQFAQYLLARSGEEFVRESLAREMQLDANTVSEWTDILESTHVVHRLRNFRSDPAKSAGGRARRKVFAIDTAYAAWASNQTPETLASDRTMLGHLFETLVANELTAASSWNADLGVRTFHWRQGRAVSYEADVVLYARDGRMIPIEVKLTSERIDQRTFVGLDSFERKHAVGRVIRKLVIYTGERVLPFGDRRWAIPIGAFAS